MGARDFYFPLGITLVLVDSIAMGLRFWARSIRRSTGYDDYTMGLALALFIVYVGMTLRAMDLDMGSPKLQPDVVMLTAAMHFTCAQVAYLLAIGTSKIGVGLVLYRLTNQLRLRWVRCSLIGSVLLVFVVALVSAVLLASQCEALSMAWARASDDAVTTDNIEISMMVLAVVDLSVAWFYALLPIYLLRNIRIHTQLKMFVIAVMGFGLVSSIITVLRFRYVLLIGQMPTNQFGAADKIQLSLEAALYNMAEIGSSIFAGALTAIRPLLQKVFEKSSTLKSSRQTRTTLSTKPSGQFVNIDGGVYLPNCACHQSRLRSRDDIQLSAFEDPQHKAAPSESRQTVSFEEHMGNDSGFRYV